MKMSNYGKKINMTKIPSEIRTWIYGIIAATVPLLVTVGSLRGDVAGHLLNVAAAVLAIGGSALAIANVSDFEKSED
jgi:hypothetical protein